MKTGKSKRNPLVVIASCRFGWISWRAAGGNGAASLQKQPKIGKLVRLPVARFPTARETERAGHPAPENSFAVVAHAWHLRCYCIGK